jgi:hypothetical protein
MSGSHTFEPCSSHGIPNRLGCMYFRIDDVAFDQARVLAGKKQIFPRDNYSPVELNGVDVLRCACVLKILVLESIL